MNAIEHACHNQHLAKEIAHIVQLFRNQFATAGADLAPWGPYLEGQKNPDSIDLSFVFRDFHPDCQSECILVQIHFVDSPSATSNGTILGLDLRGYNNHRERWRLSTIGGWCFEGKRLPSQAAQLRIKYFCQMVLEHFRAGVQVC